jgi:hypothetical protein
MDPAMDVIVKHIETAIRQAISGASSNQLLQRPTGRQPKEEKLGR